MYGGLIPEAYTIPKFHGATEPREYDDNSFFILHPDKWGMLTVDGEEGSFPVTTKADFLKLFKTKHNWTYSRLNEIDCLFKCFTREQLLSLHWFNEFTFDNYQVSWVIGTGKIRLTVGGNTRTSKFLYNVAPFIMRNYMVDNLDALQKAVGQLIRLNTFLPMNLISPASTTKDLLLANTWKEFRLFNKMPLDWTQFLHSCYVGPRMETRCLGTIEGADNLDLTKAYLMTLARCPSLQDVLIKRGGEFFNEAHPGSGYEIKVTVPRDYGTFPPIPVRGNGHIIYPHGEFITRVSKPYIDTLIKAGDIPFEIRDSIQIIPKGTTTYPFANLATTLAEFEEKYKDEFYPINLKLHYTIAGHMLHIHQVMDPNCVKDITYEASQDYNPVNACAIQAMVANDLWALSQINDTEAIRVDAITGYNLPGKNGYKKTPPGSMVFLTPSLKDKPGSTVYRDLIHRDRDLPFVRVNFPRRESLKSAWYYPRKIGIVKDFSAEIPPLGGNRVVERVNRVGALEEDRIPTRIPGLREDLVTYQGASGWIEEYLHSYPQTKT